MQKVFICTLCALLFSAGCTYDSKTKKTKFTPLGAGTHEIIDTVVHDVKECVGDSSPQCKTTTGHDSYDASKIKSMTNEELAAYIKKQNEKMEKKQKEK